MGLSQKEQKIHRNKGMKSVIRVIRETPNLARPSRVDELLREVADQDRRTFNNTLVGRITKATNGQFDS